MKKILFSISLFLTATLAQAGGFQVNTQGQKALGFGGAYAARGKDASSVYFNPGATAMYNTGMVSAGATFVMPKTVFSSTNTGQQYEMQDESYIPAYVYAKIPITENLAAGLSVNSPFRLKSAWDDNWEGRAVVREFDLNTYYFQPTLSYKFTESFSVGAGLVIGRSNFTFRKQIGELNIDAVYKANDLGYGLNVGILGKIDEDLAFGISFRSPVKFEYTSGEANYTNVPATFASQYKPSDTFKSEIETPSTLSVGITDRISDKLSIIFEFNMVGWSSYDSLNFVSTDPNVPTLRQGRKYENSMAFRAGAAYAFKENVTLRGGVYYDETPVRDEFTFPDLPTANKVGLTAGFTYVINPNFEVDAAYVFEWQDERNVRVDTKKYDVANIAGTYKTLTNGVGIGLNYNF